MSTTTQPPAMIASLLAEHDLPLASVAPISSTQKYLLRLVLFGAGKTVKHRGGICEVLETHDQLRRLLPLINEDLSEAKPQPFWVPLQRAKQETVQERTRRQYDSGLRVAFKPPNWTGESRPKGARRVKVRSSYPSQNYLHHLVNDLGYNKQTALAVMTRGHLPWLQLYDRRKISKTVIEYGIGTHPDHPYVPLAPNKRTKVGGGYRKEQVTAAIEKHRWSDAIAKAVYEIVYMRREPFLVAASLGLKLATVYQYCSRVRADLRREQAPQEAPPGEVDLHVEDSKSFVFSESV